jgi:drug/metabolite transporter (DMT)-like permease
MNRSVWLTFGALCLLSASAWIATPYDTSTLPSLESQGLLYAAIGLIALLISARQPWSRNQNGSSAQLALAGLMFFGLPAAAIDLASGSIPAISRSALFAMVPIVVILAITSGDARDSGEAGARRLLTPTLVGAGGLLLLLPLDFSGTTRGTIILAILCAAVIVSGLSAVWLFRRLHNVTPSRAAALICLPTAAFLLFCSRLSSGPLVLDRTALASLLSVSSLVGLIEILLLLRLVRAMPPIRFAARYLVIPLLTVLEGYIIIRPPMTLRIAAGAILLIAGTATLLLLNPSDEEALLSLR